MASRRRPVPPVPDDLTKEEKWQLVRWVQSRYPEWSYPERLRWVVSDTLDYHRATGNPRRYHDWVAVCRNRIRWLAIHGKADPWNRDRSSELPRERRELTRRKMPESVKYLLGRSK